MGERDYGLGFPDLDRTRKQEIEELYQVKKIHNGCKGERSSINNWAQVKGFYLSYYNKETTFDIDPYYGNLTQSS